MSISLQLRSLWKYRGASGVTILTLATSVAVLLATIAVAHNFFISPWPYDTRHLGVLTHRARDDARPAYSFSATEYRALRDSGMFSHVSASRSRPVALLGRDGYPTRSLLVQTVPEARLVAGNEPVLGRFLTAEDASGADSAAVISYELWQSHFSGDAAVLGSALRIEGSVHTVIGVMPERFHFLGGDIWVPHERSLESDNTDTRSYIVNFRLRRGNHIETLRPSLDALGHRLAALGDASRYPTGWSIEGNRVIDAVMGPMRPAVNLLIVVSVLMLLVVLANVATLINVRQVAMESQLALRLALGATFRRLLGEAFLSNLLIATTGVGLGWALGGVVFERIVGMISYDWIPRELEGHFAYSGVSLQWMPIVALGCGVLMTLSQWPRLQRIHPEAAVRGSARVGSSSGVLRAIRGLAAMQVSAAALVGVLAICVWSGSVELGERDIGLRVDEVLSTRLTLPNERYPDAGSRAVFVQRFHQALADQPGLAGVVFTNAAPFQRFGRRATVSADVAGGAVSAGVGLRTSYGALPGLLDIPLVHGRYIDDDQDVADSAAVAVVNRSLALKLWGTDDVLGRSLTIPPEGDGAPVQRRIIGVLEDAYLGGALAAIDSVVFIPQAQDPALASAFVLLARGSNGAVPSIELLARTAAALDPGVPLFETVALADRAREALSGLALAEAVFVAFAILAGALALMGTAVVLQFLIAVRRREYAVRSAMGATSSRLFAQVFGEGLRIGIVGALAGGVLSWFVARMVSANLHDATPWRPLAVGLVVLMLLLVAVLASVMPARRAASTDPALALRGD